MSWCIFITHRPLTPSETNSIQLKMVAIFYFATGKMLTLTFINPSLFSLWSFEAALWSRFLWEFKIESITRHHVRQFKRKAKPTTHRNDIRIAFTVMLAGSTLKIARRVIPATIQLRMKMKITKDGRQQVFFHFFLPKRECKFMVRYFSTQYPAGVSWANLRNFHWCTGKLHLVGGNVTLPPAAMFFSSPFSSQKAF